MNNQPSPALTEADTCPKIITEPPKREMKLDRGHFRDDMWLESIDGQANFRAFMRRSEDLPENFSVGLVFLPKDGTGEVHLLRCNGPHGAYDESFDPEHPHCDFHVHRARADMIEVGLRPEKAAAVNRDFASYEEALQYFLRTTNITNALDHFADIAQEQFNGHVAFRQRRPGVVQVMAPLFHEDGDMVDIFLDEPRNGTNKLRVGDHGMTLMRLTYSYDLDTPNKQRIFSRILEADGRLYIEAEPDGLYPAILQFAQTVAKVSSMQYFKREVIQERLAGSPSPASSSRAADKQSRTPSRSFLCALSASAVNPSFRSCYA